MSTALKPITLGPHMRGRTFRRKFTLSGEWTADRFDELKFTVRRRAPSLHIPDDSDAIAQVSLTGGGIVFEDPTSGTVRIAPSATRFWPAGLLHWELTGRSAEDVYTVAHGTIEVEPDITRAP